MMTNLEKLEKEIRLKLPRLMELSGGCLISNSDGVINKVHHKCNQDFIYYMVFDNDGDYQDYEKIDDDLFIIIGHEIKLNDVLEWCKSRGLSIEDYEDGNLLSITWFEDKNTELLAKSVDWDLSKNLLKDQSQELIDSLSQLVE